MSEEQGAAALLHNLLQSAEVEVFAPGGDVEDACLSAAAHVDPARDGWTLRVRPQAVTGNKQAARIVLGAASEPALAPLVEALGVEPMSSTSFHWRELVLDQPSDGLIATFQDPARPGLPVTVVIANDHEALSLYACGLGGDLRPGWRPNARAFREGRMIAEAELTLDGRTLESTLVQRAARVLPRLKPVRVDASVAAEGIECRAVASLDDARVERYLDRARTARGRLLAWVAADRSAQDAGAALPIGIYACALPSEMVRAVDCSTLAWTHPLQPRAYVLLGAELDDGGAGPALATAYAQLGAPVHAWMAQGAGVDAADRWWGQPLATWLARLHRGGLVPTIDELCDPTSDARRSAHVLGPARAALLRYLRATEGDAFVRSLWGGSAELPESDVLASGFEAWWAELARGQGDEAAAARRARTFSVSALLQGGELVTGVGLASPSLAAEPFERARDLRSGLEAAQAVDARAVSVETFAVAYPDRSPWGGARGGPAPSVAFGPLEGDAPLAWTLVSARELGLRTLLKPNLLEAPGSTTSGSLLRGTEADWLRFFDDYARFVEHFALLAELAGCDLVSIGSGIQSAVSLDPSSLRAGPEEAEWKRDGWAAVIARARAGFDGGLLYVSAWPERAAELSIFAELDAIGLDVFLKSPDDRRGRELDSWLGAQLSNVLADVSASSERHAKPVLLTSVGFPTDVRRNARGGRQARLFEGLARWLERTRTSPSGLAGVFVWRWDAGGPVRELDYVFRGEPAEEPARRILGLR